ncbi:unnamed protein product, partial [Prorocentrum cordatum]
DVIEIDEKVGGILSDLHAMLGTDPSVVRVGADVLNVDMEECDAVISGPPCPPWSTLGFRNGVQDPRASVLRKVTDHVVDCANGKGQPPRSGRGRLEFCIFENVDAWRHRPGGDANEAPFVDQFMAHLEEEMPYFKFKVIAGTSASNLIQLWVPGCPDYPLTFLLDCLTSPQKVWEVNATHCHLAQTRPRVYVIGIRRWILDAADTAFAERPQKCQPPPLHLFIDETPDWASGVSRLTEKQQENMEGYIALLGEKKQWPEHRGAKFATVDIDRALDKAFQGFLRVNTAPTFTTRNDNLYIITTQIEELHGRRMTHAERCRLSGVEPRSISSSHGKKTVIKALGNMMPVDAIGRVLNQILLVIETWENALSALPTRSPFTIEHTAAFSQFGVVPDYGEADDVAMILGGGIALSDAEKSEEEGEPVCKKRRADPEAAEGQGGSSGSQGPALGDA